MPEFKDLYIKIPIDVNRVVGSYGDNGSFPVPDFISRSALQIDRLLLESEVNKAIMTARYSGSFSPGSVVIVGSDVLRKVSNFSDLRLRDLNLDYSDTWKIDGCGIILNTEVKGILLLRKPKAYDTKEEPLTDREKLTRAYMQSAVNMVSRTVNGLDSSAEFKVGYMTAITYLSEALSVADPLKGRYEVRVPFGRILQREEREEFDGHRAY